MPETPRLFNQVEAARYLGIGVTTFRDKVHVEPIAVGSVAPGERPILRYLREDLDAIVETWKRARRSA